jgi:hypothetical protein
MGDTDVTPDTYYRTKMQACAGKILKRTNEIVDKWLCLLSRGPGALTKSQALLLAAMPMKEKKRKENCKANLSFFCPSTAAEAAPCAGRQPAMCCHSMPFP